MRARRAVAGDIEQQQIIGRTVGEQRLHLRASLGWLLWPETQSVEVWRAPSETADEGTAITTQRLDHPKRLDAAPCFQAWRSN